jgi:hypothetical protein
LLRPVKPSIIQALRDRAPATDLHGKFERERCGRDTGAWSVYGEGELETVDPGHETGMEGREPGFGVWEAEGDGDGGCVMAVFCRRR